MKEYNVYQIAGAMGALESLCKDLLYYDSMEKPLDERRNEPLGAVLARLQESCRMLGMDEAMTDQIGSMAQAHKGGIADLRAAVIHAKLRMVLDTIEATIGARKFFVLSGEEASYYNNANLFGDSFKEKYPGRAMREVFDAGNCYAASQYTACVFHCMRVAEFGLRKLAGNSYLRIKLTHNKKPCPIEYADWQKVIDGIRNKIIKVRRRPVGPKREADLQFFSTAADHCEYMKDIWRNELAHTRRFYDNGEALSVMNRVREFATAVGEHSGSSPAQDSVMQLIARMMEKEQQDAQLAPQARPLTALPPSI